MKFVEKVKKERMLYIAGVVWAIFLFLITFDIIPLNDDWYYVVAPNKSFTLEQLRPTATFWRPFDVLVGAINGKIPSLYPFSCRVLVILGHIINAYLLYEIMFYLKIEEKVKKLVFFFFMCSSGAVAVWISPDAINQAYSLLFGELALLCYLKTGKKRCYWIIFISLLFKESGVSWFAVLPLTKILCDCKENTRMTIQYFKKFIKEVLLSGVILIIYFGLRFLLFGKVELGATKGTYSLSILSLSTIKNYFNMFVAASTGIDTVALFLKKNMICLLVSIVLSMIFFVGVIYMMIKNWKKNLTGIVVTIFIILALGLPQAIIQSAGEMHAYPVLFGTAMALAWITSNFVQSAENTAIIKMAVWGIFLAFAISIGDKSITIHEYSSQVKQFTDALDEQYENGDTVLLLSDDSDEAGYSIYMQSELAGSHYGHSLAMRHNWDSIQIKYKKVKNREKALKIAEEKRDVYSKILFYHNKGFEQI